MGKHYVTTHTTNKTDITLMPVNEFDSKPIGEGLTDMAAVQYAGQNLFAEKLSGIMKLFAINENNKIVAFENSTNALKAFMFVLALFFGFKLLKKKR